MLTFPFRIKMYDKYAGKECIWRLVSIKLNLGEYESECTLRTILVDLETALRHAV
ncbi:MAG: hypothetical protein QXV82_09285 [Ignisphaera sp.]